MDWTHSRRTSSQPDVFPRFRLTLPRQFHFANIHRADVYSVLVAGGFGVPTPPQHPRFFPPTLVLRETVPVRAHFQVYRSGGEEVLVARGTVSGDQGYVQEPIISDGTPFFHVDLIAAVRVAEKLGLEEEEEENESGEGGPNGIPQGDILIDLHD